MHGIRYFIYARKSTETEDKQVTSIEDQISETKKIAKELNLEIVDIISESKSAKEPGRNAFNEMLSRIHKGEADGILCWKLNRLARNPVDGGQISWMLQQNIIKHIQTFGRDYKPQDNVLMMQVEFGMANQFINDLRVDVKRGMQKKAERGWMPTPKLPLGYLHNSKDHNKSGKEIITDKKRFKKVKRLWELLLTGEYAITDLKKEGDAMELKTLRGNYLSLSAYYRLFSNSFYAGRFSWTGTNGEIKEYKGKHEPMISEDEFENARKICKIRYSSPTYFEEELSYRSLFSCGECSCAITREHINRAYCKPCKRKFSIKNNTSCPSCATSISKAYQFTFLDKVYYRCTKKKGKCSQKYMEESELTKSIERYLDDMTFSNDFFNWSMDALEHIKNQSPDEDLEKDLIKSKNKLQRRLENYMTMRADKEISAEEFSKFKLTLQEQIKRIEKQIKALSDGNKETITAYKEAVSFLKLTKKEFKKRAFKERRCLVRQLGSNPTILSQKLYFSTPKTYYTLKECYNIYTNEKRRLEPKNNLENLSVFDQVNLPFSFLCTEVQLARTIANNDSSFCNNDN